MKVRQALAYLQTCDPNATLSVALYEPLASPGRKLVSRPLELPIARSTMDSLVQAEGLPEGGILIVEE